jgi:hypothetical protein
MLEHDLLQSEARARSACALFPALSCCALLWSSVSIAGGQTLTQLVCVLVYVLQS